MRTQERGRPRLPPCGHEDSTLGWYLSITEPCAILAPRALAESSVRPAGVNDRGRHDPGTGDGTAVEFVEDAPPIEEEHVQSWQISPDDGQKSRIIDEVM